MACISAVLKDVWTCVNSDACFFWLVTAMRLTVWCMAGNVVFCPLPSVLACRKPVAARGDACKGSSRSSSRECKGRCSSSRSRGCKGSSVSGNNRECKGSCSSSNNRECKGSCSSSRSRECKGSSRSSRSRECKGRSSRSSRSSTSRSTR